MVVHRATYDIRIGSDAGVISFRDLAEANEGENFYSRLFTYRIISLLRDLWKLSLFDIQTIRHCGVICAFSLQHPHPQDIMGFQG